MVSNKNIVSSDELKKEIQKLVDNIELEFNDYRKTVDIINYDVASILQYKKIIDQIEVFESSLTLGQKKIISDRLFYDANSQFLIMIGTILRLFNKFHKQNSPLKKVFDIYNDSQKQGKIRKLRKYIRINKSKLEKFETDYWDSLPVGQVSINSMDDLPFYYTKIVERFIEEPVDLAVEYDNLNNLFNELELSELRNNQFCHLDNNNGVDFANGLYFNYLYAKPKFQELIVKLDKFLNLLEGQLFGSQWIRVTNDTEFLDNYCQIYKPYLNNEYNKRIEENKLFNIDYESIFIKKLN